MANIKNRKVEFARFHAGVGIASKVLNSAVPGKDFVEYVELVDIGVYVKSRANGRVYEDIIPFGNILTVRLAVEEESPKESSKKA